jgi:uncharacterized protein YegL
MDLVFVLDSSGSVMKQNWEKVLNFAQEIIRWVPIDSDAVRIGLVSFGNSAQTHIYLSDHSEEMLITMAIGGVPFKDQWTNTASGLRIGRRVFDHDPRNARKVIVLVTDGESNRNALRTIPEAKQTRDAGIEIIVLAVGDTASIEEAVAIADSTRNVLEFQDFVELDSPSGAMRVLDHMCNEGPTEN